MEFGSLWVQDIPTKNPPKMRWGTPFFAPPFPLLSHKLIFLLLNEIKLLSTTLNEPERAN